MTKTETIGLLAMLLLSAWMAYNVYTTFDRIAGAQQERYTTIMQQVR